MTTWQDQIQQIQDQIDLGYQGIAEAQERLSAARVDLQTAQAELSSYQSYVQSNFQDYSPVGNESPWDFALGFLVGVPGLFTGNPGNKDGVPSHVQNALKERENAVKAAQAEVNEAAAALADLQSSDSWIADLNGQIQIITDAVEEATLKGWSEAEANQWATLKLEQEQRRQKMRDYAINAGWVVLAVIVAWAAYKIVKHLLKNGLN